MSTAPYPSTAPEVSEGPGLSEPQRIINTFIAPTSTFTDLRRNASWWVPFVISSIFAYAMVFTVDKQVGFERVTENQIKLNPKAAEKIDQLAPDQRARQMELSVKITKGFSYIIPIFILLVNAIFAGLLMATFNFGLGAEVKFGQALAIVMYSWLIGIIKSILAIITLFAGANLDSFNFSNPVGTNPAYYMSISDTPSWLYHLASWFDVITIWIFILMGIGFACVARKKVSTGIAVLAGWFAFFVLIATGWAALTS